MHKRKLHHIWTKIRPIRPYYFLILCLVFASVSAMALRQNNLNMIELREAVYQADEEDGDVEAALYELRSYVHSHMNTDLAGGDDSIRPPIQLKHRYERLREAQEGHASQANERIYTDAQAHCERAHPQGLTASGRIACIEEYVADRGVNLQPIPESLYKFDFVSPRWSPDLAGWSMVASGLFLLLFAARFGSERWLRTKLRD